MRFAPALLIAALVVTSLPAKAFVNGNQMLEMCSETAPSRDRLVCFGYVRALWDMIELHAMSTVCVSSGVNMEQLTAVLVKGVRDEPELRDMPMSFLTQNIMERVWPCRR